MAPAPSPARGEEGGCLLCGQRSEQYRRTARAVLHQRAVRLMAFNGDAGRVFSFSARQGGPFSLRKRRFSIRGRSPLRPIGSPRSQPAAQARQGPSLYVRAWRNSNVAVCQSAVPGAIPGARTNFRSCGV
jgi:hypothetical protein